MENISNRTSGNRIYIGLFIFMAGILLFAYKMGVPLPSWLFTWPWILIGIGLIIGLQNRFQGSAPYILILLGLVFLLKEIGILDLKIYLFPLILMIIGASMFFSPKTSCNRHKRLFPAAPADIFEEDDNEITDFEPQKQIGTEEFLTANAVLGGIKKRVMSKNFIGGNITTFMGGAEINFLNADMQQPVVVECNNIFGGTKLLIPANWDVKNEVTAIFGGMEDKRNYATGEVNPQKSIYLKGMCLFGGIEISNF